MTHCMIWLVKRSNYSFCSSKISLFANLRFHFYVSSRFYFHPLLKFQFHFLELIFKNGKKNYWNNVLSNKKVKVKQSFTFFMTQKICSSLMWSKREQVHFFWSSRTSLSLSKNISAQSYLASNHRGISSEFFSAYFNSSWKCIKLSVTFCPWRICISSQSPITYFQFPRSKKSED